MARHAFFSFHYARDIWRASQVRNSWVANGNTFAGFWDHASWETVKRKGDQAIKNWIESQLKGASVTIVLIGAETSNRRYVNYEIGRSYELGKGMLGIYIHRMRTQKGEEDSKGLNPFEDFTAEDGDREVPFSDLFETYDWVADDGYNNLADWIEVAAEDAGR